MIELSFFNGTNLQSRLTNIAHLIHKALTQKDGLLSDDEYHQITKFNHTLKSQGRTEQKKAHYLSLFEGWRETINGTPAHGLFIALEQQFRELCQPLLDNVAKSYYQQDASNDHNNEKTRALNSGM